MLPVELTTPLALSGLLLLVPVIILYLIKPKPKHIKFPSIMFIRRVEKSRRFRSFFRRFIRDPLLIIQIIIITLLVLAISKPFFFNLEEVNVKENTVLILDASASMQSTDVIPNRFHKARELAKDLIDKMNEESRISLVIAENVPLILCRDLNKEDAKHAIDDAFFSDTPTNIGDALLFSRDILPESGVNKKIYIFSDYSEGEGTDLRLAQKIISQENISVKHVKINEGGGNIGIIDINAKRFITDRHRFHLTFTIRNFYDVDKEVEVEIFIGNESVTSMRGGIPKKSEQLFNYEGSGGESQEITVKLRNEDSLFVDNTAFAFLPRVKKHRILLITNDGSDLYLRYALESAREITLVTTVPPVIPKFEGFDVVILGELKKELILPRTFQDLGIYVENGGHVIFLASSDLCSLRGDSLNKLIPVELDSLTTGDNDIQVQLNHEILTDVVPTDSRGFTNVFTKKHIKCREKNDSVVIAKILDSPAIAYQRYGRGKVAFVGINSNADWSNFYYSSSFPIFWLQLINWITREEALGVTSFKTGDYLPVEGVGVETPSGGKSSTSIIMDEIGFYDILYVDRSERITVNLVNEKESDITSSMEIEGIRDLGARNMVDVRKEIYPYILILILLILFIETFYYKRRGVL
ncbi:MAG: VWA domain-containing protein [Candidatus Altiarchaeota archaeon]|nr:VWA domain-containing protein [Candidatus Altiarchaeota archaeon]